MAVSKETEEKRKRDRTGMILSMLHFAALCLAVALVLRIA